MHRFNPDHFSLVIIDEAHHAAAATYREVVGYYARNPSAKFLGVTATGDRGDGEGLGCVFDSVAYRYELPAAVRDGWLVRIRQRSVVVEGLDFSKVGTTAGDFNQGDLAAVMEVEKNLHPVAHASIESALALPIGALADLKDHPQRQACLANLSAGRRARKTLVFTVSVAQAERLAEIFNRWIPDSARFVCGETPDRDRRALLADYEAGKFTFLCNVGIATEGFDSPGIELVVMARPTKSRALCVQMIGRGTRPAADLAGALGSMPTASQRCAAIAASDKPWVEILDFVGNSGRHKLVSAADVLGEGRFSDEAVEAAKEKAREEGIEIEDALEEAQADVEDQQAANRALAEAEGEQAEADDERRELAVAAQRRAALVGTADYRVRDVNAFDAGDVGPKREHASGGVGDATPKQVRFLIRLGVKRETAMSYGRRQASAVISSMLKQREERGEPLFGGAA